MTAHPYAGHPAALVLADHQPECVTKATPPAAPVSCCCGVMVAWCDFSAHQTGMLHRAGLLAPTADTRTPTQILADNIRATTDDPIMLARVDQMLDRAGLLADGPPPETLTERILAERADRRTSGQQS